MIQNITRIMRTILHIDQSELFHEVIGDICQPLGYDHLVANSKKEAMEILIHRRPDLILTAMELPDSSGMDLIQEIKKGTYGNIPLVVITSNDSLDIRKQLFSMGVADYILKTLPRDRLIQTIRETIVPFGQKGGIDAEVSQLRVAILDDSRFEREVMRSILEMNHFQNVKAFKNGEELLSSKEDFDIYLIDMVLPDILGEHVIRQLKLEEKKGMCIAVSGVDDSRAISNVLLSGADDYITKPFDAVIFTARIRASGRTVLLLRELEKTNRALKKLAITDGLTGLYNRRHLYSIIEKDFNNSTHMSGILLFDLDHFKHINDTYGHPEGDRVLKMVAEVIRKVSIPENGKPGRNGGEEFVVYLPGFDLASTMEVGDKIRKDVEQLKFPIGEKVTVSGGAACRVTGETTGDFLYRVDQALYRAKSNGRNQIFPDCPENQ